MALLILDLRSSIICSFQGEGVPQNRLMRADDSRRVENAEGSDVSVQALLLPPPEVRFSSRSRTRNGASAKIRILLSPWDVPAWHGNRSVKLHERWADGRV
jgi:hypothetical protein